MKKTIYTTLLATCSLSAMQADAQLISTIAGTGISGYTGDGGAATAAEINTPWGITTDHLGNIYFGDYGSAVVRKIDPSGNISTFAGGGTGGDGSVATAAGLSSPIGIVTDKSGNVYIADAGLHMIGLVDPSNIIHVIGGTGVSGSSGDGGPATAAKFNGPTSIARDNSGNLYIADRFNHKIRMINTSGIVSTIAGTGAASFSGDGGAATGATLNNPMSVVVDPTGNIFVMDYSNARVRKIDPSGTITTYAGNGTTGLPLDGSPATAARVNGGFGLALDAAGNLFISEDATGNTVRVVNTAGIINTIAGNGISGYTGDAVPATSTSLWNVKGVTVDVNSNVLMSDAGNRRIRKVDASALTITGVTTLCAGNTTTLSSSGTSGAWTSSDNAIATVSSSGVVTAVAAGTATIYYTQILAAGNTAFTVNSCPTETKIVVGVTGLQVFPNPSNGTFNIVLPETNNATDITLTDMLGHTVVTKNISANQTRNISFSENNLPAGNYIITATNGENTFHKKITITR